MKSDFGKCFTTGYDGYDELQKCCNVRSDPPQRSWPRQSWDKLSGSALVTVTVQRFLSHTLKCWMKHSEGWIPAEILPRGLRIWFANFGGRLTMFVFFFFFNITRCEDSVRVRGHVPLFRKMRNNKTTVELTFTPSSVHVEAKMLDKDGGWVTRLLRGLACTLSVLEAAHMTQSVRGVYRVHHTQHPFLESLWSASSSMNALSGIYSNNPQQKRPNGKHFFSPDQASTLNIIFYSYTDADLAFHEVKTNPSEKVMWLWLMQCVKASTAKALLHSGSSRNHKGGGKTRGGLPPPSNLPQPRVNSEYLA